MIQNIEVPCGIEADVSVKLRDGFAFLLVDDNVFEVKPTSTGAGVWRRCPGLNVSDRFIVRCLVRSHDRSIVRRPATDDDIRQLESFVDCLKDIIKALNLQLKDYVNNVNAERKKAIQRTKHYGDDKQDNESLRYVYLFRHSNGLTKIGYSKDPRNREKTLQAEDPRVHLLAIRLGTFELEQRLHRTFREQRVRGEWFDLSDKDVDWIVFLLGFKIQQTRSTAKQLTPENEAELFRLMMGRDRMPGETLEIKKIER